MERKEVIENLKIMRDLEKRFSEEHSELKITTLDYAIKELERTAQEVPVQEQLVDFSKLPTINSEKLIFEGKVVD